MSDIVIKAETIGKKYVIGHQAERGGYTALRDVLMQSARTLWNKTKDLAMGRPIIQGDTTEEVWALKDVSFEIRRGEAVGIIGRNGAGKSTLLKILSRITEPSAGRITIKGRVASLLEVGTGFHPELTGRENIYLNGTILGMTRSEIKRKFDEIVTFAEVERYLDTPVKRYSSGMYVRLAFAVAAHLEPEILIVDEVLSVGDAQFQKKCLGKMEEVGKEGRTVLFVSHNMVAIRQLCDRAIVLANGFIACDTLVHDAISFYMQEATKCPAEDKAFRHIKGDGRALIEFVSINAGTKTEALIAIFEPITVTITYMIVQPINTMEFFLLIYSADGEVESSIFQRDSGAFVHPDGKNGKVTVTFMNHLMPGEYSISAGIFDGARDFVDWVEQAGSFNVEPIFHDGQNYDHRLGKMSILAEWGKQKE